MDFQNLMLSFSLFESFYVFIQLKIVQDNRHEQTKGERWLNDGVSDWVNEWMNKWMNEGMNEWTSERNGAYEQSEQFGASEQVTGASERANGQASGPVLTSRF